MVLNKDEIYRLLDYVKSDEWKLLDKVLEERVSRLKDAGIFNENENLLTEIKQKYIFKGSIIGINMVRSIPKMIENEKSNMEKKEKANENK